MEEVEEKEEGTGYHHGYAEIKEKWRERERGGREREGGGREREGGREGCTRYSPAQPTLAG